MKRLINVSQVDKERASRDPDHLKKILVSEYEAVKEELVTMDDKFLPTLRGEARMLAKIIKLLERA